MYQFVCNGSLEFDIALIHSWLHVFQNSTVYFPSCISVSVFLQEKSNSAIVHHCTLYMLPYKMAPIHEKHRREKGLYFPPTVPWSPTVCTHYALPSATIAVSVNVVMSPLHPPDTTNSTQSGDTTYADRE